MFLSTLVQILNYVSDWSCMRAVVTVRVVMMQMSERVHLPADCTISQQLTTSYWIYVVSRRTAGEHEGWVFVVLLCHLLSDRFIQICHVHVRVDFYQSGS